MASMRRNMFYENKYSGEKIIASVVWDKKGVMLVECVAKGTAIKLQHTVGVTGLRDGLRKIGRIPGEWVERYSDVPELSLTVANNRNRYGVYKAGGDAITYLTMKYMEVLPPVPHQSISVPGRRPWPTPLPRYGEILTRQLTTHPNL
ncbi:hypothetical protein AAG570_002471 [Ranatra chinensis]|uniref:Uncharacterized protein n=1 Tax=Ranatra chinensis TaxID=642074 RepID=A0ABD0Y7N4_9HEMI